MPKNKIRKALYSFLNSKIFEVIIISFIVGNVIALSLPEEG